MQTSAAARQAALVAVVIAVCGAVAWVGLGPAAKILFIASGLGVAEYYRRRSPWLFITATLWFWALSPLIRRLIDFRGGFDPTNIVLATPNAMAALMAIDIVTSKGLFRRIEALVGLLVLLPLLYGLAISFVNGQIFSGLVGSMDWLIPVLYYFYIIIHARRIAEAEVCFRTFLIVSGVVVVGYSLYQAWAPPPWDMAWVAASGLEGSSKSIAENGFRMFGTLNSAGVFAFWLFALIVLSIHFRSWVSILVLPAAGTLLLLSGVRSVAGATVGCLVLAVVLDRRQAWQRLVTMTVAAALVGVVIGALNPSLVDRITDRFGSLNLQTDDSALVRKAIWERTPALVDAHPYGLGLGALGRGAVVSNDEDLVSIDFGPLAIYLTFGWVAGTVYLMGLCLAAGQAILASQRTRSSAALAFAVTAVGLLAQLPIVNIDGVAGVWLWICAATPVAYRIAAVEAKARRNPIMVRHVALAAGA